ncbi:deoxyribonuclease IV, partial [Enterococcus faecium]
MLLGSHVSLSGKKMLFGAAAEAASYGSSTFMIYTGAPQNTRRKAIEEMNIDAGKAYMAENGLTNIIVHAPYIINLGNTIKPE